MKVKKLKKGFSMIEIIIVIAVIGVLTAVVLSQAQGMRESSNINKETSNLSMLVASTRAAFNSQGYYGSSSGDDLTNIVKRNSSFPTTMLNSNGNGLKSTWGDVTLENESYSGTDLAAFKVTFSSVPASSCYDFVEKNITSFYKVSVDGDDVRDVSPDVTNQKEGNVNDIADACGDSGTVDVIYYSR